MSVTFSCESTQKTYVSVVFDVEDYISPIEEGVDEIPKWMAETMTEVGVTGTFFVIGEKARSLEERGRQDVIEAMASHDIGSHTNQGSIHPTVTEILEAADWETGVRTMMENESAGIKELERIFEVPVTTFARHGGSYGPQLVTALGEMGRGYVYSPVRLPGHYAVWFCNALNFHGDYGSFDNLYYKDELFDPALKELEESFSEDMAGLDVVSFFACHPTKVRAEQFWDFNFYEGANPSPGQLLPPKLRPAESMETARKNFKRLMQFLADQDYIEITTFSDLMERFSWQPEKISQKDLKRIAVEVVAKEEIIIDEYYSPSEIFAGLTRSIVEYSKSGKVPKKMERESPLGPMEMPIDVPEVSKVTMDQVSELAGMAHQAIQEQGYLPSRLHVDGKWIGTGSLLSLFCSAYLDVLGKGPQESYEIIPFDPYPTEYEEEIISEVEGYKYWIVHRLDLDMSLIAEYTRLQLWTLKPAHEN